MNDPPLAAHDQPATLTTEGAQFGLPAALRAELDALAAELRRGPGISHWARAVARRAGGATEFLDRRPYADGDDVRSIDWHAFAKTGKPVVKRFAAEQAPEVNILLDLSKSMDSGEPSKLEASKQLALALAYLSVASESHVQVWAGQDAKLEPLGAALSRSALPPLWATIAALQGAGASDLGAWIAQLQRRSKPGALLVVSDLMFEAELGSLLGQLQPRGYELAVFHLLSRQEMAPELDGDATLVSIESGATLRVRFDAEAQRAYGARLDAWKRQWHEDLAVRGQRYSSVVAGAELAPLLRAFVHGSLRRV